MTTNIDSNDPNDLLEDDEQATTGVVEVAQRDGEQLRTECSESTRRVQRKFEALRKQLSGSRYSQVSAEGRKSKPAL